jgi:phosphoserine aminotransferase
MISFYPGPSRVYDEIPKYVQDAAKLGVMSINHRSEEFIAISKKTIALLQQKLNVPKNYTIFFTSSATECWEIIAQSWITDKSYHLYNGAFGQKWFEYTYKLKSGAVSLPFDREEKLNARNYSFEGENSIIAITQNETSNGTQVSGDIIKKIKKNNTNHLVAVDATSSMAGIVLDFKSADIWFASAQKCFGLPAGMGLMICSPAAIALAKAIGEASHYNSITFMASMMEKWQTSYTPNVLSIYLLMRVLEKVKPIKETHVEISKRYTLWVNFLEKQSDMNHLVKNKSVHSLTVLPVTASAELLTRIKNSAKKKGFLLGEGYGDLRATTFRIANFPALKNSEVQSLMRFLKITLH